jgi:murein DD-endopeptidase MepM/ murein hydrolase activator NlpD
LFLAVCLFLAIGGDASPASAAWCKTVRVDSQILIDGRARPGIPVKVTADLAKALGGLLTFDYRGEIEGRTDASGRLRGSFRHCGPHVLLGAPPPILVFSFRTSFNGDVKRFGPGKTSYDFRRTVDFNGEGAKNFIADRPPTPVKFRFPVEPRHLVDIGKPVLHFFGGPFGVDHRPPPRGRSLSCVDYAGRGGVVGPPYCYGGHDGTDYMLKGGFAQMDRPGNWIVAAANGRVTAVRDDLHDRCRARLYSGDTKSFLNVDCFGKNPGFIANHIKIDHGSGVETWYWHIKKGSAQVKVGDSVKCGQRIALIGSSGLSSAPHLHFEVRHDGAAVDPYKGKLSPQSYWVQQNGDRGFPASTCP